MIKPLIEFGLLALGLAAALALFLSVKREIRTQARQNSARIDEVLQQLGEALRPPPPSPVPEPAAIASPSPELAQIVPRSGMNMNKRVQAGRLLRRGEDVSHVAAALGVPRCEIELMIRVQTLSAQRAAGSGG
jgi:hypothetical protein